jgi:hypothetical protein
MTDHADGARSVLAHILYNGRYEVHDEVPDDYYEQARAVLEELAINELRVVQDDRVGKSGPPREDETQTLTFRIASAAAEEAHRLLMFLFATDTIDQQAYAKFTRQCKERDAPHGGQTE